MTPEEKKELAHYRELQKKKTEYNKAFCRKKYKRISLLLPREYEETFDKAKGNSSSSSYVMNLIYDDMKKKGLI